MTSVHKSSHCRPPSSLWGPPRSLTDSFFQLVDYGWPTKPFSFTLGPSTLGPSKSCADSSLNHAALELGKHAQHLKHRFPGRCRGVEALLMQEEIDARASALRANARPSNVTTEVHIDVRKAPIPRPVRASRSRRRRKPGSSGSRPMGCGSPHAVNVPIDPASPDMSADRPRTVQ